MAHFTEDQLRELETVFGLTRKDTIPVRDGVVARGTQVWWRSCEGPQLITAGEHWDNIMSYPTAYQLDEPRTIIQYKD